MSLKPIESNRRDLLKRRGRLLRATPLLTWLLNATAFAQGAADVQICEDFGPYRHIRTAQPRPNGPMREDNITDEEVRELQNVARLVYPDTIVIIGAVTDGCDCEDGSSCTNQVWLVLNRENYQTRNLVLSKIGGHWKVGAVQSWLIEYDAHQSQPGYPGWGSSEQSRAWRRENQRLLDNFPTCPVPPANWKLLRSANHLSTCIDTSSMQASEFIRRMKFKTILPPRISSGYPQLKYTIDLTAFDCRDHRLRIDEIDSYYDDGRVTKGGTGKDPVLWDPVRPGTLSAADLDFVCSWSSK
jgi:hypothetical protein